MKNQHQLCLNEMKNDYFTLLFQIFLIISFLSSQYDEWYLITRSFLVIATSVAISGSMIMKNGFYGFFLYGENRHLNGSQRDSIKR